MYQSSSPLASSRRPNTISDKAESGTKSKIRVPSRGAVSIGCHSLMPSRYRVEWPRPDRWGTRSSSPPDAAPQLLRRWRWSWRIAPAGRDRALVNGAARCVSALTGFDPLRKSGLYLLIPRVDDHALFLDGAVADFFQAGCGGVPSKHDGARRLRADVDCDAVFSVNVGLRLMATAPCLAHRAIIDAMLRLFGDLADGELICAP